MFWWKLFTELLPASKGMQAFWKHLPHAAWSDGGTALQLSASTSFLGVPRNGDKLMMRACYTALRDKIADHFGHDGDGFAVLGNAGRLM
jgi:hypothetical protein